MAQEKANSKNYQIGDKIPDILFDQVLNHSANSAKLSELKNIVLILDFWATWCGSCIKSFPKLDSLQQNFGKHLQIWLINNSSRDDQQKISDFLHDFKREWPSFSLPLVVGNEATKALYHKGSLPHYLWIGYDRKIKAITGAEEVNAANLERLVAGLPLNLPVKEGYHAQ